MPRKLRHCRLAPLLSTSAEQTKGNLSELALETTSQVSKGKQSQVDMLCKFYLVSTLLSLYTGF